MAHLSTLLRGIVWIGLTIAHLSGQGAFSTLTLILLLAVLLVALLGLKLVALPYTGPQKLDHELKWIGL